MKESQADKFAELARALECDEDEAAFDAKLREVAKHKPVPATETPELRTLYGFWVERGYSRSMQSITKYSVRRTR